MSTQRPAEFRPTGTAGRRTRRARWRRGLSLVAGAAIAGTLLAVLPTSPSEARYATGGNGAYLGAIDWFEWGAHGTAIPAAGLTETNTRTVAGGTLATTCTISSLSGSISAYRSGSWGGDGMDEMYNIGGTGGSNQLVAGLANSVGGTTPSFTFACSTTLDGVPVPLAGLVMADAEQSGSNEYIQATIPAGAEWRLIDRFRSAGCTSDSTVNRTDQTLRITGPASVCGSGPDGIAFMDGATSADVALKGGGVSAIALGVMLFNDFGDAPASYGAAGALYSPNFTGGVVPQGDSSLFGATLNTPTQPATRLGATVDSEANAQDSADATADGADEDGISPPASITVTPGETYTLPGVACTGPGAVAGWLDWNGNGTFDAGERSSEPDCTGSSVDLVWDVPADAKSGPTFLRLRIGPTAASIAQPTGVTTAGEIEDYRLEIVALADYGDAPASYGTTGSGAASHTALGYDETTGTAPTMLGAQVDIEADGAPGAGADGDDTTDTADEDGVTGPVQITFGEPSSLTVSATNDSDEDSTLAGWVDLDGDGQFQDDERVTVTVPANSGTAEYQLDFPSGTTMTDTYARFRIYGEVVADPQPTGGVAGGEVEDHAVTLLTPQLDIEKTSNATADARPGDTITYTVTAQNTGTGDFTAANPARVGDDLSGVLDDATYNNDATADRDPTTPTYGAGTVSWTGALPAGATVTITYTVTLTGGGDGAVRNVAFQQCDPADASCDPATPACDPPVGGVDPVTGKPCAAEQFELPKLTVVKVADRADLPAVGQTVTYTVTVTNEGPGDYTVAAPATVTDDMSDVIDDTSDPTAISASVGEATFTSPNLTWTGVLAEGEVATIEYTVTYTGMGDYQLDNNACVPVEDAQDPQDPCAQVRVPGSGLDQDKVAAPASGTAVDEGDEIVYTLRFTNTGQAGATVDTSDDLAGVLDDAEFVVGSLTTGAGLNAAYDPLTQRILVTGSVPVGEEIEVSYRVRVRAWAVQGDHVLRNALQCQPGETQPCAPEVTEHAVRALDIEKSSDRTASTVIGDVVTYTVTATNLGDGVYTDADPAVVRDTLAGVLDDADFNDDLAADLPGTRNDDPPVIRWEGALGARQTMTLTYSVTLTGQGDLLVRNVAWGGPGTAPACDPPTADGVDPDSGQPCAEEQFGLPNIADAKSVDPADGAAVAAGEDLVYTLTFTNNGTAAGGVSRNDYVGMMLDDASIIAGPTVSGQGDLSASVNDDLIEVRGTLGPGDVATVTYTVRVKPDAQRAADGGDDMLGNFLIAPGSTPPTGCEPEADEDSTCNPVRHLDIDKASSRTIDTGFGDAVTYTITATNVGQGDYTAQVPATIRDDLTDVLDDADYNNDVTADRPGTTSYAAPVIEWTGALAAGQTVTMTYTVTLRAGGDLAVRNVAWGGPDPKPDCDPPTADGYDAETGSTCDVEEFGVPRIVDGKSVNPRNGSVVNSGQRLTYTLTFTNSGSSAGSVNKVDNLSQVLDDAKIVAGLTASDPALAVSAVTGRELTITGTLQPGQTVTVTYTVQVRTPRRMGDGMLGNHLLEPGSPPPTPQQCLARMGEDSTCNRVRKVDLVLDKRVVGPRRVVVGDRVRYALRVSNNGPDPTLGPITVTDRLPRGLEAVAARGRGWRCRVHRPSDTISCVRNAALRADRTAPPIIVVAKTTASASGRRLFNTATVGGNGDVRSSNNRDVAGVRVVRVPPPPNTGFRPMTPQQRLLGPGTSH
ncbi:MULTISPECIES: CshA/CshB family fibrillar adhesin-related protein [Nocardioides]|uniref:CshA/CshB family fibrillar adhesin-related protein n=1 Tax=Nocardioides vastitatis TaxID=2568655 RepID=A0ABW0ZKS9_9ACTN|nr:CshA/CshB family fibrillar adhesin-related protein [Nocardioides sp.]THJ06474.1 DUF11 domain-containing protein [Nocardioides sp.]